ncbi:MAG: hypothetical protein J7K75_11195 [Desulfuromonas sp.]|nr:hypothetical protein [Desulfuromonas sp.]
MTSELRAYIAYVAAKLIKQEDLTGSVIDMEENVEHDMSIMCQERPVSPTATLRSCGTLRSEDGQNFCMIFPETNNHTCLSVYGQLFDGYDHASGSHFSGMLNDNLIELYDFKRSDHYSFKL